MEAATLPLPREGLFAALGDVDRAELLAAGHVRRYAAGETLLRQGDDPGPVLIVLRGTAKAIAQTAGGSRVLLGLPGPGDVLGELSALDGAGQPVTVRAVEPLDALAVPGSALRGLLRRRPAVALALLGRLVERVREGDRQRVDLAAHEVTARVAGRLVELAQRFGEPCGDGLRIALPLSQEDLASWAGSSREAVTRALQALRAAGWVRTERRHITVLDVEALRRLAD